MVICPIFKHGEVSNEAQASAKHGEIDRRFNVAAGKANNRLF